MWKLNPKKHRKLILLKGILVGSILTFLLIGTYCGTYSIAKQGQCMVRHRAILEALQQNANSGKQTLPVDISGLSNLEYINGGRKETISELVEYEKGHYDLKYYPNSWGEPGNILLRSSVLCSYVVTFGDGSMSVLQYWHQKTGESRPNGLDLTNEKFYLPHVHCSSNLLFIVILFFLIIAFLMILVIEHKTKKKIREETCG